MDDFTFVPAFVRQAMLAKRLSVEMETHVHFYGLHVQSVRLQVISLSLAMILQMSTPSELDKFSIDLFSDFSLRLNQVHSLKLG